MPKISWGRKIHCRSCGAKFYDLNRKPPICPHCGAEYIDSTVEVMPSNAKQVFTDDVDIVADDNLVGSDASESIAEVDDIEIEEAMDDDDTISLEDTENDVQVIPDEVDDLDIVENNSNDNEE